MALFYQQELLSPHANNKTMDKKKMIRPEQTKKSRSPNVVVRSNQQQ